jgi:hypothetical protein
MSLHQSPQKRDDSSTPDDLRQSKLRQVFADRPSHAIHVGRQEQPGLISVIASYDDKKPPTDPLARQNTLAKTIEVIAAQMEYLPLNVRKNFHVILADNGMTREQVAAAQSVIDRANAKLHQSGMDRIQFHIAHAHKDPSNDLTATAAYARNKAFSLVRNMRRDEPRFSAPTLVNDDDAVTLGIPAMHMVLRNGGGTIGAVAPLNRSTTDVASTAQTALERLSKGHYRASPDCPVRVFPGITESAGAINFCLLTAFGGTRVPKTCSLMIDGHAVQSMQNEEGELFLVCPEGSFEDMLLSGGLERRGYKIVECARAEVFDQVRVDSRARGLQQFRWAFDHATAFHDFVCLGQTTKESLIFDGVSVLQPQDNRWLLARIPGNEPTMSRALNTQRVHGAIVNPTEVRELLSRIEIALVNDPDHFIESHPYAFKGRPGSFRNIEVLQKTVTMCKELLDGVTPVMQRLEHEVVDVPVLTVDNLTPADQLRFNIDTRVARMLGNLAAIACMSSNDIEGGTLRVALLGPRQPTL